MLRQFIRVSVIALAIGAVDRLTPVVLAQPAVAPASQPLVVADPTTPKGTLTMLSRATQTGDSSDVKDLFQANTDQEKKLAGVLIERTEVYAKFRQALVSKFGEDVATQLTGNSADDETQAEKRISLADVKVEDDKATVQMQAEAGQPPVDPVQLVRVDGKWKLPVSKLTEGMDAAEVDKRLTEFHTLSSVVRQTTDEISQSKYKNADEVTDALRAKLASAMLAASPSTGPATAPGAP